MANSVAVETESARFAEETRVPASEWPCTAAEFEKMVLTYQDALFRYAARRLGNPQEAEDAVQEVFVKAFASVGQHRHVARVSSYLYRMVANACNDLMRKKRRTPTPVDSPQKQGSVDMARAPDHQASALDELRRIDEMLGRLPGSQAEVLRMRILDGLSFAQIAEILACSTGTVKSRFRYGLLKIRLIMENDWEELS